MRTSIKLVFNVFQLTFLIFTGVALASDYVDSSATEADPFADLLDLYAFVPPCDTIQGGECEGDPDELILALTLKPFATGADQFPDDVIYHFYLENDSGDTSRIDCSFSREQVITCEGLAGRSVQTRVGEIGAIDDLRVFAGLRDDPAFFDLEAFSEFQAIGVSAFEPPGTDFFAGSNVLAIVLGINISAIPAGVGPDTNIQKIWAASERVGGHGLNGAITGAWYNPDQDGQGWEVQVVRLPNGQDRFVTYFYGYEFGEQVWLVGSSRFEGNTVSVDMVRTSGAEWGNAFNKDDVIREVIGSMEFRFLDCNNATVSFTPGDTSLTAFSTVMQRLTNISSLECSLLTAGQIDRIGRPLVSEFLVSEPMRDAYAASSNPAEWDTLFNQEIRAGIEALDLADGIAGNLLGGDAQTLATMIADDHLQIDLKQWICSDYMTLEGFDYFGESPEGCGGRTLLYDVVDLTLGAFVSGFEPDVGDYVDSNDVYFLSEFPFLAAPHGAGTHAVTEWEISTPGEQGLNPTLVQNMYQNAGGIDHLYSVLVVKNGYLVAEEYFNGMEASDDNGIASVTKSVISALLGIALRENVLTSIDQKMVEFFPEIDWAQNDPRKSEITIRQILKMRSGYPWDERTGDWLNLAISPNWIPFLEDLPLSADPGTQYGYSNFTSHIASMILTRAAGKSTRAFAKEHLFGPLGLSARNWRSDGLGYYYGHGRSRMKPRDMARIGQLYLDNGVFNGKQIIPASWISESLQTYSYDTYGVNIIDSMGPWDYGYLWWSSSAGGHEFDFAGGGGGQLIVLVHDLNMVIVTTAHNMEGLPDDVHWPMTKSVFELVGEFIASIP